MEPKENLTLKDSEECIRNLDKLYDNANITLTALGGLLLIGIVVILIFTELNKVTTIITSIFCIAIYVLVCNIILSFINWQKLMLKNLKEINEK